MRQFEYYKDFTEDQLLNDEYFQNWILNRADEEIDDFWKNFLIAYPEKAEVVKRASSALQAIPFTDLTKTKEPSKEKIDTAFRQVSRILEFKGQNKGQPKVFLFSPRWWAVAASVLVIASLGYFLIRNENVKEVAKVVQPAKQPHDIAPGGNKAVLTLADGSTIVLDSAQNGMLSQQGSAKVMKLEDGKVTYDPTATGNQQTAIQYNTISTPRGGKYEISLPDGSRVWLNSLSSIRFPTTFAGLGRNVEMTGEAYFEVAHDERRPFTVKHGDVKVQVLGTHFNVKTYSDAPSMKVTLLQGSVKVNNMNNSALLSPGWQAEIKKSGTVNINKTVNLEEVMGWKNGQFVFERADIQSVMRRLARWYNINVAYKENITAHFWGSVSMDVPISKVFEMLELTGGVNFSVDGNNVTVLPGKNSGRNAE